MRREYPAEGRARRAALCIACLLIACLLAGPVLALPSGAEVASGRAEFARTATQLDVTQHTDKAIINYSDFSIAAGEGVRFYQPGSRSIVLNRVPNGPISTIAGQLTANGRVLLINPSGVVFTEGASVSVHSLIASALDLPDADFLRDNYLFGGDATDATVVNRGDIRAAEGGEIWLIAPQVRNEGTLDAPGGTVGLVGGSKAYLTDDPTGDVLVSVEGLDGEASNLRTILSDSGRIGIYGLAVNQDGLVSADSLVSNGGRIKLVASGTAALGPDSVTRADALTDGDGGRITVWSDEVTTFDGVISARGAGEGDGGFAEISSAGHIDFDGSVDLTASNGARGTLLLDPELLVIMGGVGDGDYDYDPYRFGSIPPSAGPGVIAYDDWPTMVFESEIEGQSLLSHIILQAARAIIVNGDFMGADVLLAPDSNLTLQTRNSVLDGPGEIDLSASYQGPDLTFRTQGTGSITINAGTDGGESAHVLIPRLESDSGNISVTSSAYIQLAPGSWPFVPPPAILSQSGNISLDAGMQLFPPQGIAEQRGIQTGGAGNITLSSGSDLFSGASLVAENGAIYVKSVGGNVNIANIQSEGLVSVSSAGSIFGAANPYEPDIVAPDVELVAGTSIGQPWFEALCIDAGRLAASAFDGDVWVDDVGGGLEVGQVGDTSGVHAYGAAGQQIRLHSNGPLVVTDEVVNHAGDLVWLVAWDLGLPPEGNGPVRPYVDSFYDVVVNGSVESVGDAMIYAYDRAVINGRLSCGWFASVQATRNDLIVTGVSAVGEAMLSTRGAILDGGDTLTDVVAPTIMLDAGTGIGLSGDHLEVDADALSAMTNAGGIYIDDVAGGLTVGLGSGDGARVWGGTGGEIVITASSPLNIASNVTNLSGGRIALTAAGTGSGDDLQIDAGVVATGDGGIELTGGSDVIINGPVAAENGAIQIESTGGNVSVTNVQGGGLVSVHAAGSIQGAGNLYQADVAAPEVELVAGGSVGNTEVPFYVDAHRLAALASGGGVVVGDVAGGVEIGQAGDTAGVHAYGSSAEDLIIASGGPLITAADVVHHGGGAVILRAIDFGGSPTGSGPEPPFPDSFFDVLVKGDVESVGGPGNVIVYAGDKIVVEGRLLSGGSVVLQAFGDDLTVSGVSAVGDAHFMTGGAILDGGGVQTDVVASGIELVAEAGIGLPGDHLEINGVTLAAVTATGGIYVDDVAGGLTVGTVGGTSGATVGGGTGGDIVIIAFSPLNISGNVTNLGGGRIALTASGSGAGDDLTIGGNVVATGGGSIELTGGSEVIINGDIGAEGGNILIVGTDRIALNGTCTTDSGDVSIITLVFDPGPGGQINTPGGSVHVQSAGQGGLSSNEVAASLAQAGEQEEDEEEEDEEESVAEASPPAAAASKPAQPPST